MTTNLDIQNRQEEIIRQMTPSRRLEIAFDLYQDAWKIKTAALHQQHPTWTAEQIQAAVRRIFITGYAGN